MIILDEPFHVISETTARWAEYNHVNYDNQSKNTGSKKDENGHVLVFEQYVDENDEVGNEIHGKFDLMPPN